MNEDSPVVEKKEEGGLFHWLRTHERHIGSFSLFAGLVWDYFLIDQPDRPYVFAVFLIYITLSAAGIVLLTLRRRHAAPENLFLLGAIQFIFGSFAGGLLVLYSRSGTLSGNLLFVLILGAFFVGNEFLRTRYGRMTFNISVWFFLLLGYLVLTVPIFVGSIGVFAFLISVFTGLLLVAGLITLIFFILPAVSDGHFRRIIFSTGMIFVFFNLFYFLNILPPVPLVLNNLGIYHRVERIQNGYEMIYEEPSWLEPFADTSSTFSRAPGESAYCFSSIYAPSGLSTPIVHRWERFNEKKLEWQSVSVVSFSIFGGRESGYRGYSIKGDLSPGRWRCNVETERGSLIGRTEFTVLEVGSTTRRTLTQKVI